MRLGVFLCTRATRLKSRALERLRDCLADNVSCMQVVCSQQLDNASCMLSNDYTKLYSNSEYLRIIHATFCLLGHGCAVCRGNW